jgi:hypothetical protein
LNDVTLAEFISHWYQGVDNTYKTRKVPKIIRYRNYDMTDIDNHRREMVLLHMPFRKEHEEILINDRYQQLYEANELTILERQKKFQNNMDIEKVMAECRKLIIEDNNDQITQVKDENDLPIKSKQVEDDFVKSVREGTHDDIIMRNVERLPGVVRKRENVMTSEDFNAAMRGANDLQRKLLLHLIYRLRTPNTGPLQIFLTGPAGCGKTFTVKLMMEIYNRESQEHNAQHNSYIATASTGMAAAAINGTTIHSALKISNSAKSQGLSVELTFRFRSAMINVRAIFLDEVSMIGSGLLNIINSRLQHINQEYDLTFGGIDIITCGDLRQLSPVCQAPVYKRTRENFCADIIWRSLKYYPLEEVMRQSNLIFSTILTKIGDGQRLTDEEKNLIESRFVSREVANEKAPDAIRLFFNTHDVYNYNSSIISGTDVLECVADDSYRGAVSDEQKISARAKVHKMKPEETGGLPYLLRLQLNRPYMVRSNIDTIDGIVNGVKGRLRYIEKDEDDEKVVRRLWLEFDDERVGRLLRGRCKCYKATNKAIKESWVPIMKRSATIQLKSKIITCKRTQFPLSEACSITIHKSQGGSYQQVVYDYKKSHDQRLVYVALSRATSLDGLFLTNSEDDFTFYHARGTENQELKNEFERLKRNLLVTVVDEAKEFLSKAKVSICTFNTQSLGAHRVDLETDTLILDCNFLLLNETWLKNNDRIDIKGFHLINQFKRNDIRSGGVAIYQNMATKEEMPATSYELYKYEEMEIKEIKTKHDDVGDICTARVRINGVEMLMIGIYISPKATTDQIHKFLTFNLMSYSPKLKGLFKFCDEKKLYDMPMIVGGDFNTVLEAKDKFGDNITDFMKDNFDLDLTNNPNIGTTKSGTCIDGVFSRYIPNINTRDYISYFSYHKPLLTSVTF